MTYLKTMTCTTLCLTPISTKLGNLRKIPFKMYVIHGRKGQRRQRRSNIQYGLVNGLLQLTHVLIGLEDSTTVALEMMMSASGLNAQEPISLMMLQLTWIAMSICRAHLEEIPSMLLDGACAQLIQLGGQMRTTSQTVNVFSRHLTSMLKLISCGTSAPN